MVTGSLQIAYILAIDGRNYPNMFKRYYLNNGEDFLQLLYYFFNLHKILLNLKKEDQPHSLNILQVIDPDKCGCFKDPKLQL